jgi:hypothetical protein
MLTESCTVQTDRDTDANWSEMPVDGKTTPKRVRHRENCQLPHAEGRVLNEHPLKLKVSNGLPTVRQPQVRVPSIFRIFVINWRTPKILDKIFQ